MKRLFKIAISVLFVVTIIGMIVYVNLYPDKSLQATNVFEEMYSQLKSAPSDTMAREMGGRVLYRNFREPSFDKDVYSYGTVDLDKLPSNVTAFGVRVSKKDKSANLHIYNDYQLSKQVSLIFIYDYSVKSKVLTEEIQISEGTKSELEATLGQQGLSLGSLRKEGRKLLGKTMIRFYKKSHTSRFSEKNWGDVTIKSAKEIED